jgi:hypothetical protein
VTAPRTTSCARSSAGICYNVAAVLRKLRRIAAILLAIFTFMRA